MSVVIAAFNSVEFIGAAIQSALAQTLSALEIIVVDDCSTDGTPAVVDAFAQQDRRVRLVKLDRNSGPAEARNVGLDVARGEWIAVFDSDDLMAPDRLALLVSAGVRHGADIIADDLVVFDDSGREAPKLLVGSTRPIELTFSHYLQECVMYSTGKPYGYLKPVFRRVKLLSSGVRYDPRLRIAEDDDLIVRLLAAGMRYILEPIATYGYRKHAGSISHRLSYKNAMAMLEAGQRQMALQPSNPNLRRRLTAFCRAAMFARFIEELSARRWRTAAATLVAHPAIWPLLRMPILSKVERLMPNRRADAHPRAVTALAMIEGTVMA